MWGIFIGFALGVFEVLVLRKTVEMITASKSNIALGVLITVGKLALSLVVLWLMAKFVSLHAMMWCAGGLAVAMIGIPIVKSAVSIKKYKQEEMQKKQQEKPQGGEDE